MPRINKEQVSAIIAKYNTHPEFIGIGISDLNQKGAVDDTLLHLVARTGAVEDIEILVSAGANINVEGDLGNTPLHQAAMMGKLDAVKTLLKLGADPQVKNEFNESVIEVARLGGYTEIIELIDKYISKKKIKHS